MGPDATKPTEITNVAQERINERKSPGPVKPNVTSEARQIAAKITMDETKDPDKALAEVAGTQPSVVKSETYDQAEQLITSSSKGLVNERVDSASEAQVIRQAPQREEPQMKKFFSQQMIDYAKTHGALRDRLNQDLGTKNKLLKNLRIKTDQGSISQPISENTSANGPLTEEEIKALATQAYHFIREQPPTQTFTGDAPYRAIDLKLGRHDIDPEYGKRFDAHGIAKGSITEQLRALNYLLTRGIDPNRPFHSLPLRLSDADEYASATGMGSPGPYDNGNFIVISRPDGSLRDGVAAVLVEEPFYSSIPEFQKRFPGVHFIRGIDAPQAVQTLVTPPTGKSS